jgi:hypothetical protein
MHRSSQSDVDLSRPCRSRTRLGKLINAKTATAIILNARNFEQLRLQHRETFAPALTISTLAIQTDVASMEPA